MLYIEDNGQNTQIKHLMENWTCRIILPGKIHFCLASDRKLMACSRSKTNGGQLPVHRHLPLKLGRDLYEAGADLRRTVIPRPTGNQDTASLVRGLKTVHCTVLVKRYSTRGLLGLPA